MIAFLLAAAVQFNDPDPLLWMAVYSSCAVICFLHERGRRHGLKAGLAAIGFFVAGAVIAARVPSGASWMNIETAREAMGLFVCSLWMTVLAWSARHPAPHGSDG